MMLLSGPKKNGILFLYTLLITDIFFDLLYLMLKWYYDENRIFLIEAILKHKQVVCLRRKMAFTSFKYLFSFQRYSSF